MRKTTCHAKEDQNQESKYRIMKKEELIPKKGSEFLKVECPKCKNEQVIFSKPAENVKCQVCENILAKATGGKAELEAKVLEVLE